MDYDMDCSPILLDDVNMDVLMDTPPHYTPYTQWNTIQEYVSVPSFNHSTPHVSVWKTSVKPLYATQHSYGFPVPTTLYAPSFDTTAPLDSKASRSDTALAHWQELPHRTDTHHPATLVGGFERMLTSVIPPSRTDNRADPSHHCATLVHIPHNHPDESPPFQGEATEPFAKDRDTPPLPFEHDIGRIYSLGLADQPKPPPYAVSLPTYTSPRTVPRGHPRPPTPPSSARRPPQSIHRSTGTTYHRAPAIETDLTELPVVQASVQAGKRSPLNYHLGDGQSPWPALCHVQSLDDDGVEIWGSWSGWGVPSKQKTTLDWVRPPSQVQCRRQRRKVEEEPCRKPEPRARAKQTRFVVPDPEDEGEDFVAVLPGRPRRTRADDGTRRTSGLGPLRSILRNKPAPYEKGTVRHAGRKATVP